MPLTQTRKIVAWRIFWTLLAAAFLYSTALNVVRGFSGRFLGLFEPFHSTDLYLQSLTSVPQASQKFEDLIANVSKEKPILIVVRQGSPRGSLMGMVMAYLAWPRPARIMTVAGPDPANELAHVSPETISAVILCEMRPPPWLHAPVSFGQNASVVVLKRRPASR
jgi:hypothetical protein